MKSVTGLDLHGYCMMNILDYLIGSTDRHWENRGVMVDNETNKPIRLYDLMDFNQAFNSYNDTDGANCLTAKRLNQREAAENAVKRIGLNQISPIDESVFRGDAQKLGMFKKRLSILQSI